MDEKVFRKPWAGQHRLYYSHSLSGGDLVLLL